MNRVKQSPNDLLLAIFSEDLPIQVTVLRQREITCGEWRFTFMILSESHLVRIERGGKLVMQELLMCSTPAGNYHHGLHRHRFDDLQPHAYAGALAGYHVQVAFGAADLWAPVGSDWDSLDAAFAEVYGQVPTTQIAWRMSQAKACWRTLHVYPSAAGATHVVSESKFGLQM